MKNKVSVLPKLPRRPEPKFHVGDLVQYDFVDGPINARIVEYRGPIAEGGRHLYRFVGKQGDITRKSELREEDLRPLVRSAPDKPSDAPSKPD